MLIAVGNDIILTSSDSTTALRLALQQSYFDLACQLIEARYAVNCVTRGARLSCISLLKRGRWRWFICCLAKVWTSTCEGLAIESARL